MSLYSTATLQSVTFYNTITYYLSSGPMKRRMLGECCGISSSLPFAPSHTSRVIQPGVLNEKLPPYLREGEGGVDAGLNFLEGAPLIREIKMNPARGVSRPDVL